MAKEKNNAPVAKYRVGFVTAAVWKNGDGFYNVTVQRSYKDGDEYKNTESLGHGDVVCAIKALERAEAYIAEQA